MSDMVHNVIGKTMISVLIRKMYFDLLNFTYV